MTARFDGSGIRLYRKPTDWEAQESAGSGIEFIDHNHRYIIAPCCWHHSGYPYRLRTPDAKQRKPGILVAPSEFPGIPSAYLDGLRRTTRAVGGRTASVVEIEAFATQHTAKRAPSYLEPILADYRTDLAPNLDNTHGPTFNALCRIARESRVGAFSFKPAVRDVRRLATQHYESRGRSFDKADFVRMVGDAVVAAQAENLAALKARVFRDYGTDTRDDDDPFNEDEPLPWERYPLTTATDLAADVTPAQWLVDGVWIERSAGVTAGKKKTFKTWQLHSMAIAIAANKPYLDEFEVINSGPVLYLCGEGGIDEFKSRHQAIAERSGINRNDLSDLPFGTMFDVASLSDADFMDAVRHHLDALQPVAVYLDPLYPYHPHDVTTSDVYSRGPMLAKLRQEIESHAALIVGDHINKTAPKSLDLDNIGYSGMSQRADSWSLQRHRVPFRSDSINSYAKLEVEFGSRRTGSRRYDIDWHLVRDTGGDRRVIRWRSCDWSVIPRDGMTAVVVTVGDHLGRVSAIQDYLDLNPDTNKTNTVGVLNDSTQGSSREDWRQSWDLALRDGYIVSVKTTEERKYGKTTRPYSIERFKRGKPVKP